VALDNPLPKKKADGSILALLSVSEKEAFLFLRRNQQRLGDVLSGKNQSQSMLLISAPTLAKMVAIANFYMGFTLCQLLCEVFFVSLFNTLSNPMR
jgi:hypothetical protein